MSQQDIYNDDLFREAGENYPLKTENANWDAVYSRLKVPVKTPPVLVTKPTPHYARYAWLLLILLIPAGFWVYQLSKKPPNNADNTQPSTYITPTPKAGDKQVPSDLLPNNNKITGENADMQQQSLHEKASNFTLNPGNKQAGNADLNNHDIFSNNMEQVTKQKAPQQFPALNFPNKQHAIDEPSMAVSLFKNNGQNVNKENLVPNTNQEIEKQKESIETKNAVTRINKLKTKQRFSLGISAGPSFSSVKNQSIPKAGYSLGMLVSYKFDRNWSVETGVLFVKKYFNAAGEDFKKDQVKLPNGTSILKVNGAADITQVPLTILYNFDSKSKSNFFASAGLISNVIHTESYDYELSQNTTGSLSQLSKSYRRGSNNVFSNLSLGVGYSQDLGRSWSARIEPYYQMPLFGIGLGSMPVKSLGINFQITKSIK